LEFTRIILTAKVLLPPTGRQSLVGQGLRWTSHQPDAETSTCTTQHSQETSNAPSETTNCSPSKRAATHPRLGPLHTTLASANY